MNFVFLWCLFLQLVGACAMVRALVHVLYLIVVREEKSRRNRKMERGF